MAVAVKEKTKSKNEATSKLTRREEERFFNKLWNLEEHHAGSRQSSFNYLDFLQSWNSIAFDYMNMWMDYQLKIWNVLADHSLDLQKERGYSVQEWMDTYNKMVP